MMQAPIVTVIPANITRRMGGIIDSITKTKVAAYARVSTDEEDQLNSYAAQVKYYTEFIQSNTNWEFVEVYADEGLSGTSRKKRKNFNRMIDDALNGKIDVILTKSVSRFARNTVDSLVAIRQLREKGCEVRFEKENIQTLDSKGELVITIMSSIAQEESRNISENVAWGARKRMADGKVSMPYGQFLGYEKGPDGKPQIVESEAVIVRQIYGLFLRGMSYNQIARHLTERGVPTPRGKRVWSVSTVESILINEKYRGDAILQKTFTVDFLGRKRKVNEGELPQYHVKESHPAIIAPQVHEMVQREIERRAGGAVKNGLGVFARRVLCGECGGFYGAKVWHSKDKYRRTVYQCNEKYRSSKRCATPHVTEAALKGAFIEALNRLTADRTAVVEDIRLLLPGLADTSVLEKEKAAVIQERDEALALLQHCIRENTEKALDQREYNTCYQELLSRYEACKEKVADVETRLSQRLIRCDTLQRFVLELEERPGLISDFDEAAWHSLVDWVTITEGGNTVFRFRSGTEISVKL